MSFFLILTYLIIIKGFFNENKMLFGSQHSKSNLPKKCSIYWNFTISISNL